MKQIFPDHSGQLNRLARIEGQVKGIRRMVDERRYCVDIANQIKAVKSALTKVEFGVLEKHIHHCVKEAIESGDQATLEDKVEEIITLVSQME